MLTEAADAVQVARARILGYLKRRGIVRIDDAALRVEDDLANALWLWHSWLAPQSRVSLPAGSSATGRWSSPCAAVPAPSSTRRFR
ncbi:MAG TPA: hypothetical protein VI072_03670 [Polyangiaceae bacterium]